LAVAFLFKPDAKFQPVSRVVDSPKNYSKWTMNEIIRDKATPLDKESQSFIGAEDFTFDLDDNVYTGLKDGRIMKWTRKTKIWSQVARLGRTLGIRFDDKHNRLLCADADLGLVAINMKDTTIEILARESAGLVFKFTDAVAIHSSGMLYFTDASDKWGYSDLKSLADNLEGLPHGRLLSYDPKTRETKTLLDGMYFANGITLSKNEDFLLVCETHQMQITKYWLRGAKAGTAEPFMTHLPGLPDNIITDTDGSFWFAFPAKYVPAMSIFSTMPWLRILLYKYGFLLDFVREYSGHIVHASESGEMLSSFHDTKGSTFKDIATITFNRDRTEAWLGSYQASGIYRMDPKDLK